MAAFGVLVTKKDQTLANLSCVSPRQGLFSEIVYSDSQAFANETEDQMDAWLDTVIAAQKLQRILIRKLKEEMPRLRKAPSWEGKELCVGGLQSGDRSSCSCRKWV